MSDVHKGLPVRPKSLNFAECRFFHVHISDPGWNGKRAKTVKQICEDNNEFGYLAIDVLFSVFLGFRNA